MKNTLMKTTILSVALFGFAGTAVLVDANATANVIETQIKSSREAGGNITNTPQEVMFFSNYPQYNGNGFNQSTYDAASAYADNSGRKVGYEETESYSETGAGYVSPITQMYENGKTKTIISSGFQVANTFMGDDYAEMTFANYDGIWGKADSEGNVIAAGHEDEHMILLDDNLLGTTYANAASVQYKAEGAGYLAGLASAAYTLADEENADNKNIVMWGGINYPTVYSFMSGFAQAIDEVNEITTDQDITLWSGGDFTEKGISEANTYGTSSVEDAQTWYTGGFDGGTGTGSDPFDSKLARQKTMNAVNAGASIVFPIAGGNTEVALNYLTSVGLESTNTRLVGVDTDNSFDWQGKAAADFILFSATKSLKLSGAIALAAMDDIDGDGYLNKDDALYDSGNYSSSEFWLDETTISTNYTDAQSALTAELAEWTADSPADAKGLVMTGDLANGGVGVVKSAYGTGGEQFDTVVAELPEAILTEIQALAAAAAAADIEAADDSFTTATMPTEAPKDSNLTWLWIVLGVILAISIIGIIVFFVLKALKKEE